MTLGERHYEWEKKGVPVRIEIGPKDVKENKVVVIRRDTSQKNVVEADNIDREINLLMEAIQRDLYKKAKEFMDSRIYKVDTYNELVDVIKVKNGFALAHWDRTPETEALVKEKLKATIRCIPFDSPKEVGKCVVSGKPSTSRVIFAKAY